MSFKKSLSIKILSKCYIIYVCLLFVASTYANSKGAPSSACTSMTPGHYPSTSQSLHSSPYTITAELNSGQWNTFTITISSSTNTPFKGILLQARATASGNAEGSWQVPSGGLYKNLACSGATGALTHTSEVVKSTPAQFIWISSSNTANYTIYATVVRVFATFYVKIPSTVVSVQTPTTESPATTTTAGNDNNTSSVGVATNEAATSNATSSPISTSSEISSPFMSTIGNRVDTTTGSGGSTNYFTPSALLLPLLTHLAAMIISVE